MSCFINPVNEDQCVFLSCEGQTPALEIAAARYDAGDCLLVKHWHRLLLDLTQLSPISSAAEFSKLLDALSVGLPSGTRVALVVCQGQSGLARLARVMARNRGVQIDFFFDVERATHWVKEPTQCPEKPSLPKKKAQPVHV